MKHPLLRFFSKVLLSLVLITGAVTVGWLAGTLLLKTQSESSFERVESEEQAMAIPEPSQKLTFPALDDPELEPDAQLSELERQRKLDLRQRRLEMGVDYEFYQQLVNQLFWQEYPEQQEIIISNEPQDALWRETWDQTAIKVLDKLALISDRSRRKLGKYSQVDRNRYYQEVNQLNLSSRTLSDLVDAEFFYYFPNQIEKSFTDKPIEQVWLAIATEKLNQLQSGKIMQEVNLSLEQEVEIISGKLKPGQGRAYLAQLTSKQLRTISLQTSDEVLLSVYSPTGNTFILEDSKQKYWAGEVRESGFYEFVIVSQTDKLVEYQLSIVVNSI